MNLAANVPDFAADFPRVAEIVDETRNKPGNVGRERFRHYKQQWSETVTHNIGSTRMTEKKIPVLTDIVASPGEPAPAAAAHGDR